MSVRFGVFVPQGWKMDLNEIADPVEQYEAMTRVARAAEAAGLDSIWLYDHFLTVPTIEHETTFECWTATAGLARDTRRVRIGQMVTANSYRNPALLAKMASTVDVMSHGRLNFGLGAGWYEEEYRAYGYSFPDIPERMGMFREAVELIHRMWTQPSPAFAGRYYRIEDAINVPPGAQQPHIPMWIGGSGERVTLRLVAKFGAAANIGGPPEVIRHKLEVLRRHCEDVGRDYDQIIRSTNQLVHLLQPGENPEDATVAWRGGQSLEKYREEYLVGRPDEVVAGLQAKIDAGINYLILYLQGTGYDPSLVEQLAREVVPHLQG